MPDEPLIVGSKARYAPQQYAPQAPPQAPPPPPQYTQRVVVQPQYVQQRPPPQEGLSGARRGAIGFSLMAGLFPIFNPLFLPIQMTIFIIMIIVLLFKGYGFWTAALLSWLIPGLIAAVFNYMLIGGAMSVAGYGEAPTQ